jgi:hypothetical protein
MSLHRGSASFLRRNRARFLVYGTVVLLAALSWIFRVNLADLLDTGHWHARRTVEDVVVRYGPVSREKFEPLCRGAGVDWPPARLTLLVLKREARLEVWAANREGPFARLASYPVLAVSGGPGPKRRSGDRQVPEGVYAVEGLNPNSHFHLSIKVGYPNDDDRAHATVPEDQLGGDIFIHGSNKSIGCVAIGDPAIEEVFPLVASVPASERKIIIVPADLRAGAAVEAAEPWIADLYGRLRVALEAYPSPPR